MSRRPDSASAGTFVSLFFCFDFLRISHANSGCDEERQFSAARIFRPWKSLKLRFDGIAVEIFDAGNAVTWSCVGDVAEVTLVEVFLRLFAVIARVRHGYLTIATFACVSRFSDAC